MSLISRMRLQKAVWWKRSATPDRFGRYTFSAPVEIDCRWVDKKGEYRNAKAEAINSRAEVYVDREMDLGDMLQKGELDSNTPLDPRPELGAMPIIGWNDTPNFQNTEHLLQALL